MEKKKIVEILGSLIQNIFQTFDSQQVRLITAEIYVYNHLSRLNNKHENWILKRIKDFSNSSVERNKFCE